MKNIKIVLFGLLCVLLHSCAIHQNYHFKKDYSGSYEMDIELSQMISFSMMMDTTGMMTEEDVMLEMVKSIDSMDLATKYNLIDGIDNAFVGVEGTTIILSYDFKNIDALNKSNSEMGNMLGDMGGEDNSGMDLGSTINGGNGMFFSLNKNELTYSFKDISGEEENLEVDGIDMDNEDMMEGIGEMFDMTTNFTFDRKVKKVTVDGAQITKQTKNMVHTTLDISRMAGEEGITIKFKLK